MDCMKIVDARVNEPKNKTDLFFSRIRNMSSHFLILLVLCAAVLSFCNTLRREHLLAEANRGKAQAQYELGMCYYEGKGVSKDEVEAVRWWRKAAEQGEAIAQCSLGVCYAKGKGVSQDYNEAVKWYRKGAEQPWLLL